MNFKMMVTNEGKHPASKWAELAADDIVEISAQAPTTLMREAMAFRKGLVELLTHHHQVMIDHEMEEIKNGVDLNAHYETEDHASNVVDLVCGLAKGSSFEAHFDQDHVKAHIEAVLNKYFKSAKLVERHHYHTEKERAGANAKPKK